MARLVVEPNRMYERCEAAKKGIVTPPLVDCYQHELGHGTPLTFDPMGLRQINEALAKCGPYRVLYDWSTTGGDATKPGWHLYEILQRGITEKYDMLTLVCSLQYTMDVEWPTGTPRNPGLWLVEELKRREKLKDSQYEMVMARYTHKEIVAKKKIEESATEYEEECAFVHNTPGLLKKVDRKHKRVATPKAQVLVK